MTSCPDNFLYREMQMIRKIIDDETWLEGERRGCYVPRHDPVVRERVCAIVMRVGGEVREAVTRARRAEAPADHAETAGQVAA